MPTKKISISIDEKVLEDARELAGDNLSAWISELVEDHVKIEGMRRLVAELEEEWGPVPEAVKQEVRRKWRASRLMQDR